MDFPDLPGRLRTDVHVTAWLQGAERGNAAFDIAARHLHGGEFIPARRHDLPRGVSDNGDQTKHYEQGASGGAGTFHAGFRPVEFGPSFGCTQKAGSR